jgi:hypothetical protein
VVTLGFSLTHDTRLHRPPSIAQAQRRPEDADIITQPEKQWLIQCKREKSITPKKLKKYAGDVTHSGLYGVIFAAPCELSKTARDVFRAILQRKGIQEIHIWGKAELEDMLFQPKNDHLLFAYFGFSIAIRRRTAQTEIRRKLSMKKKALTLLGNLNGPHSTKILLRDVDDTMYPQKAETGARDSWRYAIFNWHYTGGIVCMVRQHFAYLHDDKERWDYVESFNEVLYSAESFYSNEDRELRWKERNRIHVYWNTISKPNRAWLEILWRIPYEEIIAIDGDGDALVPAPHVYLSLERASLWDAQIKVDYQPVLSMPDLDKRMNFFPKTFPEPSSE